MKCIRCDACGTSTPWGVLAVGWYHIQWNTVLAAPPSEGSLIMAAQGAALTESDEQRNINMGRALLSAAQSNEERRMPIIKTVEVHLCRPCGEGRISFQGTEVPGGLSSY